MNTRTTSQRHNHRRMRRVGALALALMMLTVPVAAVGASSPTSGVDPSGPVHGGGTGGTMGEIGGVIGEATETTGTGGTMGEVGGVYGGQAIGGGYVTSAGSRLFAQVGSDLSCLAWSELDLVC